MENDKNKLFLLPTDRDKLSGNFVSYELSTADPDGDDFKTFYPLATEVIEHMFVDCVTLCEYHFVAKSR